MPPIRLLLYPIFAALIAGGVRLLSMTLRSRYLTPRYDLERSAQGQRVIYAFWHGQLLFMGEICRKAPRIAVMISPSDGGDVLVKALRYYGHEAVRGSASRRSASAMIAMIRAIRNRGLNGAVALDGPQGPVQVAKKGVLQVAQKSGALILPVGMGFRRAWIGTVGWDWWLQPLPFSRGAVAFGKPFAVPEGADLDAMATRLGDEINRLTTEAAHAVGGRAAIVRKDRL